MRKWKDNQNNLFHPKLKKIMLICSIPGFLFGPVHLILYHAIIIQDILDFAGSLLIWYLVKFGGAYKFARWLAERRLRQRDNKWKYGK